MIDEKTIVKTIEWIADNIYLIAFYVLILLTLQWLFIVAWIWIDAKRRYSKSLMIVLMTMIGMVPLIGLFLYLILRNKYSLDEKYYIDLEKKALYSESLTVMECYKCKHINENENSFCTHCGTQLRKDCPNCKNSVAYFSVFCSQCGYSFKKESEVVSKQDNKNLGVENKASDKKVQENVILQNDTVINVRKVENTSKDNTSNIKIREVLAKVKNSFNRLFNNINDKLNRFFSRSMEKGKIAKSSGEKDKK